MDPYRGPLFTQETCPYDPHYYPHHYDPYMCGYPYDPYMCGCPYDPYMCGCPYDPYMCGYPYDPYMCGHPYDTLQSTGLMAVNFAVACTLPPFSGTELLRVSLDGAVSEAEEIIAGSAETPQIRKVDVYNDTYAGLHRIQIQVSQLPGYILSMDS